MSSDTPKRRWYQFSLRKLLLVIFFVTVGWIGFRMYMARENRARVAVVEKAVAWVEGLGGTITSEYEERRSQTWLERQFDDPGGPDNPVSILKVRSVVLNTHPFGPLYVTDADLIHLSRLTYLEELYVPRTSVTDDGLKHLKVLTELTRLSLVRTEVTDAGLEHLRRLTNIRYLYFDGTEVTDAGLEHLNGLNNLRHLSLDLTDVTDEGVEKLQQALPKCNIFH